VVKFFCSGRISATPSGWNMALPSSGGIAPAQPPANFWQPSGLTVGALKVASMPVKLAARSPNGQPYREAVIEISRESSAATPPDDVPLRYSTPKGC